ncbi:hypothetical protein [Phenylobacterium sp.]|jgi:hypothetical protein|uniref:hypothetical protein n=1 Tax=Phenylobacterium sp. TaxID=1871053 RepID=UPI0025E322D8|nr:hypothetical protein [Phenylobacterium sp.]
MSDRFYQQMLSSTGWCPGYRATTSIEDYENKFGKLRRKRKMAWEDSRKQEAVDMYTSAEPTPETSMEIVADIAEQMGESVNGVRMILTKAGVYVKKTPAARSSSNGNGGGRVSVADAQNSLTNALTDAGIDVDSAIISKLTGKAAVYFTSVIEKLNN